MENHKVPELSKQLYNRIRLVRRDIGDLLFHFTRSLADGNRVEIKLGMGVSLSNGSAYNILRKILHEGKLQGTSTWTNGEDCVCFTEAPIQEFNSIFSLVSIAASKEERPRYEPYGIAVSKQWLFKQGGRPVIYDSPSSFENLPPDIQHRFVPYDLEHGVDFTWEREWRIRTSTLALDPKNTLVVVPTSDEAFELVYEFADLEADFDYADGESYPVGTYHIAHWLAVSLDLFSFNYEQVKNV